MAKRSKLPKLKEWGDKYGRYLGKYLIQEEKHLSDTCVVYFGTEINDKSVNTKETNVKVEQKKETNVALKFFKDSSAFLRELAKRDVIRISKSDATQFVIAVRAAYTDSKKGLNASAYLQVECNQTIEWKRRKGDIEFNHLLVMERGGRNDLSDIISHQNFVAKDILKVRDIAIAIARILEFLNETCGVMHGDVKARNFVPLGEDVVIASPDHDDVVVYAAIDLDNAALIGKEYAGQKRTSSGYMPPEQADVEYYLRKKKKGACPADV
jgi:serine/threonine protein kinase